MIDWTKSLELIDGTPVKLGDPIAFKIDWTTKQDQDGDYWIEREDGEEYKSVMGGTYEIMCVHPDGREDSTDVIVVRNRAEP